MAKQCINQINMGKKKSFSTYFGGIDPDARDLLTHLLAFNPKERLTAEEALEHPYLREFHDPSEQICYNGVIEIPIDDNTKFSIKEYRQALYKQISKKYKKNEEANTSVLSTQDSNNQKKKDSLGKSQNYMQGSGKYEKY